MARASFTYDAANRLSSVTYPGGSGTSVYSYTPTGRLASISDPDGATTTYGYSTRGELTRIDTPDGVSTTNVYDSAGRLSLVADATNLVIEGQARPWAISYSLSPGGRRTGHSQGRFSYSGGGFTPVSVSRVDYVYTDDGSIAQLTSPELIGAGSVDFDYDEVSPRLASRSPPGQVTYFGYDASGRATEATALLGSGGLLAYPTRYDPAGNVIQMGDSTYSYDAMGRLKSAHDGELGDDYEYQYDSSSNRTRVEKNGQVVQELDFGLADMITSPGFAYDASGRLVSDTTPSGDRRGFLWDGYGRLVGVDVYSPRTGKSENLRMRYDTSGRLSEKTHYLNLTWPVERLFYHYDGDRLVTEEDMTGTVREYLYAGGEAPTAMRARQADGTFKNYFFVTNTHGDVVGVTDRDGNIVNRYAYGPWGEATRVSEQVHQPFRYAGYRYEDGFDLYYLRARWMDPNTGRFLSRDPLAGALQNVVALNKYIYGHDSPATRIDPSGYGPRTRVVIAFLHGISATGKRMSEWIDFLKEKFPSTEVFAPDYGIGPINLIVGDESQVKRISEDFRSNAAGRPILALGHSYGGILTFKAANDAPAFVSIAITMGSPVSHSKARAQSVSWWLAICGEIDAACSLDDVRSHQGTDEGPTEVYDAGPIGHSDYFGNGYVKELIVDRFSKNGAS